MNTKLWGKKDKEQWQRKLWHQYHTELKPLVRRGSHALSPARYSLPCHCQASPWVLGEPIKPFLNSNLRSNYTVRRPLNAQSLLCKVICWQLCILKAREQWKRSFLFIIISPAMIKKRGLFDIICPLHSYPGRRPGNVQLGGNESCCYCMSERQSRNLRVQGIEAASLSALKKPRSQVQDMAPSQTE